MRAADEGGTPRAGAAAKVRPGRRWLAWGLFDVGSPVRSVGLLVVGAYVALSAVPSAGSAVVLRWAAVAGAVAVGAAMTRFRADAPPWTAWAILAAVTALLATAGTVLVPVLLLVLLLLSMSLLRLPVRRAVAIGAAALGMGLLAALRVRLLSGHQGPVLPLLLAYALTFTSVLAVRERRRYQWETERLLSDLAEEHRQLEDAYARLRESARHAAELAASEERNRIAREVHDVLAHSLTVMIVQAEAAAVRLRADPQEAAEQVRRVADLARSALQEARLSVAAMRGAAGASRMAAPAALRRLCEDASRLSGMDCQVGVEGAEQDVPAPVALAVYRITQEAITNASRHGRASRVEVALAFAEGRVVLRVVDDGTGVGAVDPVPGSGLRGMEERVRALGGTFHAGPRPAAAGFEVRAEFPLDPAGDAEGVAES